MNRTPEALATLYAKFDDDMMKRTRLQRAVLASDQFLNVVFLNGSQDETISSHIHRKQIAGTSNRFLDGVCCLLSKLETNHCYKSRGE